MTISLRGGFYGGLALAVCVGLFLIWLWRPERQITRHTDNFFRAVEHKNWTTAAGFIGSDYQDQWGDDRAQVVERMREGFRYVGGVHLSAFSVTVRVDGQRAVWTGRIWIEDPQSESMELLKESVNSLPTPFELEWHRLSQKPWDWKLVRVTNAALEIPADAY